jgi:hypothetical protein
MTREDQIFVADVVVTDLTRDTIISSVISRPIGAIAKFNAIIKIHKYGRLQKGHYFIPMTMKMHDAFGRDMNCFIRECAHLFHNRLSEGHLSLSFCIQFVRQHVSIVFNIL